MTANVRELEAGETVLAFDALFELRPHLLSREAFVSLVNSVQRGEGYRLAAAFIGADASAVAVAGFRTLHSLAWGYALYVDDFVTRQAYRRQGHAAAIMHWIFDEARRLGCQQVHLDSGFQRHAAHRFYLNRGMWISWHHFAMEIWAGGR